MPEEPLSPTAAAVAASSTPTTGQHGPLSDLLDAASTRRNTLIRRMAVGVVFVSLLGKWQTLTSSSLC